MHQSPIDNPSSSHYRPKGWFRFCRNLFDSALQHAGIADLKYQLWYNEERENLLTLMPEAELISRIGPKWDHPRMFAWNLNTYLHSLFKLDRLKAHRC